MDKPAVWQMIKEAVEDLGGRAYYSDIKKYIWDKWPDILESTINSTIIAHTVNIPSRVHYPKNQKPRLANTQFDFLFSIGSGQVVLYNPATHGLWEICKNELGVLSVGQQITEEPEEEEINENVQNHLFALETHLRDFLIKNLDAIKSFNLKPYIDGNNTNFREYPTDVGLIDILLQDEDDNFVVVETKLSRGADRAIGQLLRYMGWIKKNLAKDKKVKGLIIANKMDDKIKYAALTVPDIELYEYEMKFNLSAVKE